MTTNTDFVAWGTTPHGARPEQYASLMLIENVKRPSDINDAESVLERFSDQARIKMNPDHPKSIELADALSSRGHRNLPLVSAKLKAFFEAEVTDVPVEYLPVTVLDHNGGAVGEPYFVVNYLNVLDVLDIDTMGVTWNPLDATSIMFSRSVAVDPGKLEGAPLVLRPRFMTDRLFVRRILAEKIKERGFTGVHFHELADLTT